MIYTKYHDVEYISRYLGIYIMIFNIYYISVMFDKYQYFLNIFTYGAP